MELGCRGPNGQGASFGGISQLSSPSLPLLWGETHGFVSHNRSVSRLPFEKASQAPFSPCATFLSSPQRTDGPEWAGMQGGSLVRKWGDGPCFPAGCPSIFSGLAAKKMGTKVLVLTEPLT